MTFSVTDDQISALIRFSTKVGTWWLTVQLGAAGTEMGIVRPVLSEGENEDLFGVRKSGESRGPEQRE